MTQPNWLMHLWLEYHEEPRALHSGGRSHWLVDADKIFQHDDLRAAVLEHWLETLRELLYPDCSFLFMGVPQGGVRWAQALAETSDLPGFHLWSDTKIVQGLPNDLHILPVLVDDVATTGASLEAVFDVSARLVVVDRMLQPPSWASEETRFVAWARIPLPLVQ